MSKKVLLLEDEESIRECIAINLQKKGYEPLEAGSGETAIKLFKKYRDEIDIALLDVTLPGMSGFEVCKTLREYSPTMGIIMLTACTQEVDKVKGLSLGADDYITKPFSTAEMLARIDAVYRRIQLLKNIATEDNSAADSLEMILGEYVLDLRKRTVTKSGIQKEITHLEFQVLVYLISNPNKILSRTEILEKVWGEAFVGEEKIVDVNIRRLRLKIEDVPSEPKNIKTVWGVGYKWEMD